MGRIIDAVKLNKFWVAVALLVVVSGVTFAAVFIPLRKKNAQEAAELEQQVGALSEYETKQLRNQQAIERAKEIQQFYHQQLQRVRAHLENQDAAIEQYFEEPGREGAGPLDGSVWKMVYADRMDALQQELEEGFLVVGSNPIVRREYVTAIPNREEMRQQEKLYWVQKYAVDAISSVNEAADQQAVPVFQGFAFLEQPEHLLNPSHSREFQPLAFELSVSLQFKYLPRVLSNLLASPANFQITGVHINRPQVLDRQADRRGSSLVGGRTARAARTPTTRQPSRPSTGPGMGGDMDDLPPAAQDMMKMLEQMGIGPGTGAGPGAGMPTPTQPTQRPGRPSPTRRPAQIEDEVRARLPKNLVDVVIRGYVADYVGADKEAG